MHEGDRPEYLSEEWLDGLDGKAAIVVVFDELIKRWSERIEDEAEVTIVIERMLISNDALLILLIPSVDVLQDLFLDKRWLNVLGNRSDNLRHEYSTLIAYRRPFFSP